ncbi:MAG: basic amino acid ABC transporter substrate-binding protein [bacterium]|nr:basic amino acid ABC transporter substrate-binding protein [bacterium]
MKKRSFGWSWLIGLSLFIAMIGWMFYDIMSREGIFANNENYLVMGTNAGFKPFEYQENGKIIGFDVDLAKEIAKELGKELKISDMSFDGLLPALESGQVDMVVAGMTETEERRHNALFSDPYFTASQRLIVRRDGKIRNKYQLSGNKIGVQLGTTGDTLASKIENVNISQFPNAPSVLQELAAGGVDAVILDDAPASQYVSNFENLEILAGSLSDENYAIAIRKDNQDLQKKINAALEKIKQDGRYYGLVVKYFGENVAREMELSK